MDSPLHILSICSGIGGLDLGIELAVPRARTVCYLERESFSCEVLARAMEADLLAPAPIWTDAGTFDGKPWRGVVDLVAAGIPCQPWSVAGKRRGLDDERHLGEEFVRIVGEVGPRFVFVENVPGFVSVGLPDLLGRLAELGFDAEWGVFSAASVGAPHLRKRLFLLGYRDADGLGDLADTGRERANGVQHGRFGAGTTEADAGGDWSEVADAVRMGQREERPGGDGILAGDSADDSNLEHAAMCGRSDDRIRQCGSSESRTDRGSSGDLEHADREGRRASEPDSQERVLDALRAGDLWPPGPSDREAWSRVPPEAQPAIRRMADGDASRADQLRALGNGVVPLQAAYAFSALYNRIR